MNIETIRDNLIRTIEGKEAMLAAMHPNNHRTVMFMEDDERITHQLTIQFLKINIRELKEILYHMKLCIALPVDNG